MSAHYFIKTVQADSAELHILQLVSHPNIVKLHHYELSGAQARLYFDMYPKADLGKQIKQRVSPFKETTIWAVMIQMLQALSYLHGNSILHRDVKPLNILILNNTHFVLADLGSAKVCENNLQQHYRMATQTITGTPLYIAPEIIESREYGGKADIYSLGITLIEMMQLRNPFQMQNEKQSFMQVVRRIAAGELNLEPYFWRYSTDLVNIVLEMANTDENRRKTADYLLYKLNTHYSSVQNDGCESVLNDKSPPRNKRRKLSMQELNTEFQRGENAMKRFYKHLLDWNALLEATNGKKVRDVEGIYFYFWAKAILLE